MVLVVALEPVCLVQLMWDAFIQRLRLSVF